MMISDQSCRTFPAMRWKYRIAAAGSRNRGDKGHRRVGLDTAEREVRVPLIRIARGLEHRQSFCAMRARTMEGVTTRGAVGALSESGELPAKVPAGQAQRVRDVVQAAVTLDVSNLAWFGVY